MIATVGLGARDLGCPISALLVSADSCMDFEHGSSAQAWPL